jgi:flagellar motor switch protein FliM
MGLQPGDVITTEKALTGDAFVEVEGKHKFLGQVGQLRGKRALRITSVTLEREERKAESFAAASGARR